MTFWIRKTHCWPEQLRPGTTDEGKRVMERIPSHPTRPAQSFELGWWEEVPSDVAAEAHADGFDVRAE